MRLRRLVPLATLLGSLLVSVVPAQASTLSVPYPLCNVSAVQVTTAPGETAAGMVSITVGGGNAYSTACNGYTGYVALAVLGGDASGQLAAIALDGAATGTNAGLTLAPFGYASGGAVNVGCTTGTNGINSQWCPFFQTNVYPLTQLGLDTTFTVAGFPDCNKGNEGASYTDNLGITWTCAFIPPGFLYPGYWGWIIVV
jgi:hypothetical protein